MQAASGTRGARGYWNGYLDNDLAWAGAVDDTANQTFPEIPPSGLYRDSGVWTTYAGLNLRDQIREDEIEDDAAVPLQFKYEAADCRLYYTMHNLYNMTRQWQDVAAAAWVDSSLCVEGSTGYSTTGGNKPKNKPPITTNAVDYNNINGDGYTPPAGSDVVSHLQFESGTLVDGKYVPPYLVLQECKLDIDGDYYCSESKKPCVEVDIQCKSVRDKNGKPKTTAVRVCAPPCTDAAVCGKYDPALGMHCDPYTQVEQKYSAYDMGLDKDMRKFKQTVGWAKVCKPQYGTKDLGSCSATSTN